MATDAKATEKVASATRTSAYGFTNNTAGPQSMTFEIIQPVTKYACISETANEYVSTNKTCPIDQEELLTFRSRRINNVQTNLKVANPGPAKDGIQYQVVLEDVLTTTDPADPTFRVDEPIVAMLTIRHPYSGNFNGTNVLEIVKRLLSSCITVSGTWRFEDLMRGAEKPTTD